jgi:serine/threonine-protein phosphatase PPG1
MHHLDLDECIEKLKRRELLREEILEAICEQVKEVLMRESNVVHVAAPITVVGDIHGFGSLSTVSFVPYPLISL